MATVRPSGENHFWTKRVGKEVTVACDRPQMAWPRYVTPSLADLLATGDDALGQLGNIIWNLLNTLQSKSHMNELH